MKSKIVAAVAVLAVGLVAFLILDNVFHFTGGHGRAVDRLIARNIDARGGADAWRAVTSLRLSGQMDLGQGMHVPYTIEQKRPGRMCLEFVFDEETATQCVAEGSGWKLLPFLGRRYPEPMTEQELREMADTADIDGLLFDSAKRGHTITLVGRENVGGRDAIKLEIILPSGAQRWVYLDAESALEIKLEAMRNRNGREELIETWYSDWRETDGLLIPRRQDSRAAGEPESHFLTVDDVDVNPPIEDERFLMPVVSAVQGSQQGSTS